MGLVIGNTGNSNWGDLLDVELHCITSEKELRVRDSGITSQFLIFFQNMITLNIKIISTGGICLSICL